MAELTATARKRRVSTELQGVPPAKLDRASSDDHDTVTRSTAGRAESATSDQPRAASSGSSAPGANTAAQEPRQQDLVPNTHGNHDAQDHGGQDHGGQNHDHGREQAAQDKLKGAGLRITGPRRQVLELFETTSQRHLSAEMVYHELVASGDHASIATIYRVLAQLESAGILLRHQLESGTSVFELARLGDHNHLVCLQCGTLTCFTDTAIEARQREIAAERGYRLQNYSLYTYVNCERKDCPNRGSNSK